MYLSECPLSVPEAPIHLLINSSADILSLSTQSEHLKDHNSGNVR